MVFRWRAYEDMDCFFTNCDMEYNLIKELLLE